MTQEQYDVIVVGAGIGGLAAAAFLAKGGYKVLTVEKLPFVGGRGSSLEYKGFKLTTGAGGFELGLDEDIYKPLGMPFKELLRIPKPNSVYWVNGKWHQVPESGKLRAAITLASGEEEADKIMKALRRAMAWNLPSASMSLQDWLLQYTNNEKTINVFRTSWQNTEVTAKQIFLEMRTLGSVPYGYAIDGNASLMEPFVKLIKSNGGDVWTRCRANQIIVEDHVVKGVVVQRKKEKGETRLACKAVISDVGPFGTMKLAGERNFDNGYVKDVRETIKTFPWLAFQVLSNQPILEYPSVGFVIDSRIVNWTLCPAMICPEVCPPGKYLTYVGAWIPANPPWELEKYLELAMKDLLDYAPNYEKYGEGIFHVAYFLRQEWPMYRSYDGHSMYQKTSIENLYNVGDAVFDPGYAGMWGAAVSGKNVATDVMKRIKPQVK